jgi:hypothetical protein
MENCKFIACFQAREKFRVYEVRDGIVQLSPLQVILNGRREQKSIFQQYSVKEITTDIRNTIHGLFVMDGEGEDKDVDMMSFSYDVAILKRHLKEFQEHFSFPVQYIIKEVCTYRVMGHISIPSMIIYPDDEIYAFYRGATTCLLFQDPRIKNTLLKNVDNKSEKVEFDIFYDEGVMNA